MSMDTLRYYKHLLHNWKIIDHKEFMKKNNRGHWITTNHDRKKKLENVEFAYINKFEAENDMTLLKEFVTNFTLSIILPELNFTPSMLNMRRLLECVYFPFLIRLYQFHKFLKNENCSDAYASKALEFSNINFLNFYDVFDNIKIMALDHKLADCTYNSINKLLAINEQLSNELFHIAKQYASGQYLKKNQTIKKTVETTQIDVPELTDEYDYETDSDDYRPELYNQMDSVNQID